MPDVSDLATDDVVGFDGRGGLSSSADGDFALQNDAATNVFTIDVDGSTGIVVDDDITRFVNSTNAQAIEVYNTDDGGGNAEWLKIAWDSNEIVFDSTSSGTGANRDMVFATGGAGSQIKVGRFGTLVLGYAGQTQIQCSSGSLRFWRDLEPQSTNSYGLGLADKAWKWLYLHERSSDPAEPADGASVVWQSDGTASGDDGDIMMKITDSGGTTKTVTLVDYSAS